MRRLRDYLVLLLTAVFAAGAVIALTFGVSETAAARETDNFIGTDGKPISAVCISDLGRLNRLAAVNYTPYEYVIPQHEARGKAVKIGERRAAARGTYQFVFLNLDPSDSDFDKKSDSLKPYLRGDNYWHFTLYLPCVWAAAVIYTRTVPVGFTGAISDYDFIDYSDYEDKTEIHVTETKPLFIDVKLYSRKRAVSDDRLNAATVVTVHYEGEGGKFAGLTEAPLIGSDEAVRRAVSLNKTAPAVLAALAAATLSVFLFLCFLKRELSFLPQLLIALGVFVTLCSAMVLLGASSFPYFWRALGGFSFAFILLAAFLCLRVKTGKFHLWTAFASAAAVNCIISFVFPFLPASALSWFGIYRVAVNCVFSAALFVFAALSAAKKKTEAAMLINPLIVGIAASAVPFPHASAALAHPLYWLFAAVLCVILVVSFRSFVRTERRNRQLAVNLQGEVERQTEDLKAAVAERDNLLRHVSHDTKNPISGIEQFLAVLKRREKDGGQLKALKAAAQKIEKLKRTLKDLSAYTKLNFVAEKAEAFDVGEALNKSYENMEPDCCAAGIVLIPARVSIAVFGKKNALISVLNNLILNAVEHAECREITLSAFRQKNFCGVTVTDDGKGIAAGRDVFAPYSRRKTDSEANEGLGLYLCKATMKSMGGEIYYSHDDGKLTFTVTLPLA